MRIVKGLLQKKMVEAGRIEKHFRVVLGKRRVHRFKGIIEEKEKK